MADLTARLGLTEGTNRVIDDPANPSAIGAVLDFAKDAISGYSSLKDDLSKKKAATRAAEEKATQARIAFDVTGAHDAARGDVVSSTAARAAFEQQSQPGYGEDAPPSNKPLGSLFEEAPANVSPAMERDVVGSARQAVSVKTAVEQGRMPQISMTSALNARFRALREKYPEHTEYLLDTWKKMGLDEALSLEMKDAVDEREYEREAAQRLRDTKAADRNKAIETARTTLGAAALGMSDDQLEHNGLESMRQSHELDILTKQTNITLQQANLTEAQSKAAKENLNQGIDTIIQNSVYNQAVPIIQTVGNLADALMKNPNDADALMRWQQNGVLINQMIPQIAENAYQQALKGGYTGEKEKFKANIVSTFGKLTEAFTGDHSVVQANITGLKSIETSFAITAQKALPVFNGLKALGIKPDMMPGLMRAVETNPDLQKQLNSEVNGYITDWGKDRASTRLLNIVKVLRGETALSRLPADAARSAIGGLTATTDRLAQDYMSGKDIEPDMILNGFGEIIVAASSLTPASGSAPIYVATRGFADAGSRAALIKTLSDPKIAGEDREMALATIQASRAGSASLLNNVLLASERANAASPYFKMVWDGDNGKYVIDRSGHRRAMEQARSNVGSLRGAGAGLETGTGRLARLQSMEPPKEVTQLIRAANMNLDNAIELGKHDPSTPKATDLQLRNWYGRNQRIPGESSARAPIDPNKELGKQMDALEKMTKQTFDQAVERVSLPKSKIDPTKFANYDTVAPVVNAAASRYGVPSGIALALVGKESSFTVGKPGQVIKSGTHKGDRAMGLGQVMAKTAAAYGIADRSSLDAAGEADLSMRILSDNFKKTGSWQDAVSMYFTGQTYAKAKARGATDGFNSVMEYVEDIL